MPADELCPDDFRDVGEALVVHHAVNVFPALLAKLLIGLQFPSLFVFILEFMQPQSHAANNIGSFLGQLFL